MARRGIKERDRRDRAGGEQPENHRHLARGPGAPGPPDPVGCGPGGRHRVPYRRRREQAIEEARPYFQKWMKMFAPLGLVQGLLPTSKWARSPTRVSRRQRSCPRWRKLSRRAMVRRTAAATDRTVPGAAGAFPWSGGGARRAGGRDRRTCHPRAARIALPSTSCPRSSAQLPASVDRGRVAGSFPEVDTGDDDALAMCSVALTPLDVCGSLSPIVPRGLSPAMSTSHATLQGGRRGEAYTRAHPSLDERRVAAPAASAERPALLRHHDAATSVSCGETMAATRVCLSRFLLTAAAAHMMTFDPPYLRHWGLVPRTPTLRGAALTASLPGRGSSGDVSPSPVACPLDPIRREPRRCATACSEPA